MYGYLICAFVLGGLVLAGCIGWSSVEKFKNKKLNIAIIITVVFILINIIAFVIVNQQEQNDFEEEFILEVEKQVQGFKTECSPPNMTFEVTFNGKQDVHIVDYIYGVPENDYYIYYCNDLFPSVRYDSTLISSFVRSYGEVYVDGELKYTEEQIDKNSKWCDVCDRRYSDEENVSSIEYYGMCSQCYKNYKYAMGALGKD